jgi:hypothetical protein
MGLVGWFVQEVMDLIPAVMKGEDFEDALLRLRRCINGGGGGGSGVDDDDNDSDLEIITDSITVSLRCPVRLPCCKGMMLPAGKCCLWFSLSRLVSSLLIQAWLKGWKKIFVLLFLSLFIPLVVTKFEGSSVPILCTYDLNMCDTATGS